VRNLDGNLSHGDDIIVESVAAIIINESSRHISYEGQGI
jgi:hypothetical protein